MANSSQIGAIHVEASINSGKFVDGAKKIKLAAKDTEAGVKKSFGGMEKAVGSSFGVLKAGAAGFVAALSVGAFTRVIGSALKYAAALKDVSERLGVTTRDLQTFRYAAQQSGISHEQLDNGLERLSITLGKVAAGAQAPIKALGAIGITADQLKGKNTGEALRIIADGLANIGDRSQRAAVEVALFGEAGAKLDSLLSGGSARLNELALAAEELGIVLSDEQIQKADITAKKLEAMQTVLTANIAGRVADNADSILELANALLDLVGAAGDAAAAMAAFYRRILAAAQDFHRNHPFIANLLIGDIGKPQQLGSSATVKLPPARKTGGGSIGQFLAPKSGGGRKRSPRAPKDTSLRDAFQFDQELRRAQMDVLRATRSMSSNYVERASISIQLLDLEKQAFEAEMKYRVASKDIITAQADQLRLEYNKRDAIERETIVAEERAQAAEDSARLDAVTLDLERDRLESEAQLAETASEQRDVQLRLLDLAYRQERARLETILADEQASDAAKEEARRRLANLNATYSTDRAAVIASTRGPMEDYLASLPTTAAKAQEALERLQVQGFEGLIDSVLALADGLDSAKESFIKTLRDFFLGMARLELQRGLGSILQSGGGFGGLFGSIFGGLGGSSEAGAIPPMQNTPGLDSGGSIRIFGRGGVDRNLLSLNGIPLARVSYGERVDVSNDNGPGRYRDGGLTVNQYISTPDAASFGRSDRQIARQTRRALGI